MVRRDRRRLHQTKALPFPRLTNEQRLAAILVQRMLHASRVLRLQTTLTCCPLRPDGVETHPRLVPPTFHQGPIRQESETGWRSREKRRRERLRRVSARMRLWMTSPQDGEAL